VLTGIPHYFDADFIRGVDGAARANGDTLDAAQLLLSTLASAPMETIEQIAARSGFAGRAVAARGIAAKDAAVDSQIAEALQLGRTVAMPLWGFSLDDAVATSYGTKFRFELIGEFVGLAAWVHSGAKAEEAEIIGGGCYRVEEVGTRGDTTVFSLRQTAIINLIR